MTAKAPGSMVAAGITKALRYSTADRPFPFALWKSSQTAKSFLKNMAVIAAEIPDDIEIPAATFDDIPADWNAPMPSTSTKNFGTGWAKMQRHLAFSVPSVIVPDERNYLINPLHPISRRSNSAHRSRSFLIRD
jgi:RES domain-containing protein